MKRLLFAALALGALGCTPVAKAQDASPSIKVTTKINADGTRTDTMKNVEERVTEARTTDRNGKLLRRAVFTLDEQGREIEGTAYDAKDQVLSRASMKYDAMGQLSEQVEKTAGGAVTRRIVFIRDAQGRVTGVEAYDGQGRRITPDTPAATPRMRQRR